MRQNLEALEIARHRKKEGPRQREALVGQPAEVVIRTLLNPTEELASLRLRLLLGGRSGDARGPIPGAGRSQLDRVLASLPRRVGGWHANLRLRDLSPAQRERFVVAMVARSDLSWRGTVMLPLPVTPEPKERKRRSDSKLKDRHVKVLHRLHTERGMSNQELAELVWRQAGFASQEAAKRAIARAFRRMHLPARSCAESREVTRSRGDRVCEEVKADGERCAEFAMVGERLCVAHRFPEQARARALAASPWVRPDQAKAVAA